MFTLWVLRKGLGTANWNAKVIAGGVVVLIGLAAVAFLTYKISQKDGKWPYKGNFRVFSAGCPYTVLYATYGVAAAAILLALVFSASIYYTMWAVGIALFALAVYYTTKLM